MEIKTKYLHKLMFGDLREGMWVIMKDKVMERYYIVQIVSTNRETYTYVVMSSCGFYLTGAMEDAEFYDLPICDDLFQMFGFKKVEVGIYDLQEWYLHPYIKVDVIDGEYWGYIRTNTETFIASNVMIITDFNKFLDFYKLLHDKPLAIKPVIAEDRIFFV